MHDCDTMPPMMCLNAWVAMCVLLDAKSSRSTYSWLHSSYASFPYCCLYTASFPYCCLYTASFPYCCFYTASFPYCCLYTASFPYCLCVQLDFSRGCTFDALINTDFYFSISTHTHLSHSHMHTLSLPNSGILKVMQTHLITAVERISAKPVEPYENLQRDW